MKKVLLLPVCLMLCLLLFSACSQLTEALEGIISPPSSSEDYAYEKSAEKLTAESTYYNGFLGVAYTVPGGWWMYDLNTDNFGSSAAETADESMLDIHFGEGYDFIDMASIANLQYSQRDNHIGIYISAEKQEGIETLDDYIDGYVDYMLEPYEGKTYSLADEGQVQIHGRPFELRVFDVDQSERSFKIITYTCEVNEGYYLSLEANYWPDNKNAPDNIRKFIEEGLAFI